MRGLAVIASLSLAACFTSASTDECRIDSDCNGLTCTRVGVCAASTYSLRVEWTVRGLTTDQAAACVGVTELELSVFDPTTAESHPVRPVPCGVGLFTFDKLPLGYTDITLSAYDAAHHWIDSDRGSADVDGIVQLALLRSP
jgi:hypothetical protein